MLLAFKGSEFLQLINYHLFQKIYLPHSCCVKIRPEHCSCKSMDDVLENQKEFER